MTTAAGPSNPPERSVWRTVVLRAAGLAALLVIELFLIFHFYLPSEFSGAGSAPAWMDANTFIKTAALSAFNLPTAIAFCILSWTRLGGIAAAWREEAEHHAWLPWLFANAAIFGVTLWATFALNAQLSQATQAPWGAFALWSSGAVLMFVTLFLALAPARHWLAFVRSNFVSIILAIAAGALLSQLSSSSQYLWTGLSEWTLRASTWILRLYEPNVATDVSAHIISVGDFSVFVGRECSGYEGIGLVIGFLSLFVWAFRKDFRFPNVLFIFPIGIAAIWWLNALRIAVLVSLGAHVSPTIAVGGFHSYAGWLTFLIVSVSLMFVAYRIGYFRSGAKQTSRTADPGVRLACAYLLPFVAIITAGIIAKMFSENGQALYALSVAAACAAMWPFRDIYLKLIAKPQWVSVFAGLAIGVGWIATDPGGAATSTLGIWISSLPTSLAVTWIFLRVVGTSVFVPIAEELAFRGYLHGALISRRFETVAPSQFTWAAFLISTALFAVMHQRWLSAAIAGAIYAIVMYRSGRISDAIVAHAASNVLIAAWAIIWGQWSLL